MGHQFRLGGQEAPDYQKAYNCFLKAATLGNPDGFNCMAIMEQKGIGREKDESTAVSLFKKAASLGSGKAMYNLGLIYKFGYGVEIDYQTAYEYFQQCSDAGYPGGMYGIGYFLFKGLGVDQNYEEAFNCFSKGAKLGRSSCKHMLGISYRNGYGVEKNLKKAREWLEAAAQDGYDLALDELLIREEENNTTPTLKSAKVDEIVLETPKVYKKIKGVSSSMNLQGSWEGKLATYDFSGKYLIKKKKVTLVLQQNGKNITGSWQLGDSLQLNIQGYLTDSLLFFTNADFDEPDRYQVSLDWAIEGGTLESYTEGNRQVLAGNIYLYSSYIKEPGRPTILLLSKELEPVNPIDTITNKVEAEYDEVAYNEPDTIPKSNFSKVVTEDQLVEKLVSGLNLKVYPNPFTNQLNVQGYLDTEGIVSVALYNLSGHLVQNLFSGHRAVGQFSREFILQIPPGSYILSVRSHNQQKSIMVIKK
jgi:hypothetical protein